MDSHDIGSVAMPDPRADATTDEGFPRRIRLRRRIDYRRVQNEGRCVRQPHLIALYLPAAETESRFGITVSRQVGGAVVRNRVKRWLKEAIRRERRGLRGRWDVVFIARPRAAEAGYAALRGEVVNVFRKLGRRSNHRPWRQGDRT